MKVCCTSNILISTQHNNHGSCKRQAIKPTMQVAPKVMPPISLETTAATKNTITLFDRANSQLQNTVFQRSHHHLLCIFASNEQEPACCARNYLHQQRWPTAIVTTAEVHDLPPHCAHIHCSVSLKCSASIDECQWVPFFFCTGEFNDTPLLHLCFHVRLLLCCHLSHGNKM